MKIICFLCVLMAVMLCSIYGSEQTSLPVYSANVPAPMLQQADRQPSARTTEYKQAYKTEKLKAMPYVWEGSWLQRSWQNLWRRAQGKPSARQIDYEAAYGPRKQAVTYGTPYGSLASAYEAEAKRDMDIAEKEYMKANQLADKLHGEMRAIGTAEFRNLAERERVLEGYPYSREKMERLRHQYDDLSAKRAALTKELDIKSKEAIWRAGDYGAKYRAWSKLIGSY